MTINFDPRSVFACYLQGTYLAYTKAIFFLERLAPSPTNRAQKQSSSCAPRTKLENLLSARQAFENRLPPEPDQALSTLPTQCGRELPLLAKQLRRSPLRPPPLRAHQHPWRSHNPPVLTKHLGDLSPPTKRPHQDRTIASSLTTFHPRCSPNN